ncbi:unnamed protein product [Ilex paraguariensis]|uniref:Uncharacterized protein n=1 Tax=Ilex paraguariensis TaxID=185542 RepID=A0ABC8SSU9_9AQUA
MHVTIDRSNCLHELNIVDRKEQIEKAEVTERLEKEKEEREKKEAEEAAGRESKAEGANILEEEPIKSSNDDKIGPLEDSPLGQVTPIYA